MKHLPNTLTLANLFCGCLAIVFILNAPVFLNTVTGEDYYPVMGLEQIYWGAILIGLAALFDVFDGLTARLLNVESAIGKDLDSLADVVSFGVAPAMILYKLLWFSYMREPGALDTPVIVIAPAFLIPCFGALRLARYNQNSSGQKLYFSGMPIPAAGLVIASLPLMQWFPSRLNTSFVLNNRWVLYGIILVICYLMVSKIKFLKWKAPGKGIAAWWPQMLIALVLLAGFPYLKFAIVPLAFVVYIILSLLFPYRRFELSAPEAIGK
jgi:CDP-diacylglycerol--serine O-phosphatidyltransferase